MKTLFRQLKLISYCLNFFIIFYGSELNASAALEQEITLKVYNVGQGNLIILKVPAKEENQPAEYMMVDIGSSSYAREWKYQKEKQAENQDNLKKEEKENFQTPLRIRAPIVPQTEMKTPDLEDYDIDEAKSDPSKILSFIKNLRKELKGEKRGRGRPRKNPLLNIKTVVLTHPDYDHYGWLTKFFSEEEDDIKCTVSNLIFGGFPKDYFPQENNNVNENKVNEDKRKPWLDFLKRLSNDKTSIYFPGISKEPIKINALEDISNGKFENAVHAYDKPGESLMFGKAFEFQNDLRVYCLGANPTNNKINKNVVRLNEDSNANSLVLKIVYGSMSAILTGDATRVTTDCIMACYKPNFLKSNLLIASHHGSSTHGSNEQKWIKAVNPECIFVSNGLLYGHPSSEAYENFKSSMKLKFVSQKHEILVAEEKGSYQIYETNRSIFSTLSSGNLEAIFTKNSFKIKTQKQQNIEFINLPSGEINDAVTFVEVNQNLDEVIATPKKEISSRKLNFNVNENLENETLFSELPENIPSFEKEETVPLKKDKSKTKLKSKLGKGKK